MIPWFVVRQVSSYAEVTMAGLAVSYSIQIARELTKIAVALPGAPVKPGDIIRFPFGTTSFLRRPKPYGSFEVAANLSEMGIQTEATEDTEPDPYVFASVRGSDSSFSADGEGNVTAG